MATINKPMIDHKSLHGQPPVIFRLINHTRFYYPPKWALQKISDAIKWGLEAPTSRGLVSMEVQSKTPRTRKYLTCIDELGPGILHDLMGLLDWSKTEGVFNFLGFIQDSSGSIIVTHFGPLCHTKEEIEIRSLALIIQDCCKNNPNANNEERMNKNQEGKETGECLDSAELLSTLSSLETKRADIARQLITARTGSKLASKALKDIMEAALKAAEEGDLKKLGGLPGCEQKTSLGILSGLDFSIWRALHNKWIGSRPQEISVSLELLIPSSLTIKSAGLDLEQLGRHVADEFRWKRGNFMQSIIEIAGLNKDLIKANNSIDDLHDKLDDHRSIEMKASSAIITNIIEKIEYCLEHKCFQKNMHLGMCCAPANDQASQEAIKWVTSQFRSFRIMTHGHNIFDEGNILAIHNIIDNSKYADTNLSIIEKCLIDAGYTMDITKTFITEAKKIRQGLNSEGGESITRASATSDINDGHRKLPAQVDEGQREYKKQRTNV